MTDTDRRLTWEHEFIGEFSDYKVVEELDDNGATVRISFHMERPPRGYNSEIWSWSGAPRAFDAPASTRNQPQQEDR